jgi:hypothetical protein
MWPLASQEHIRTEIDKGKIRVQSVIHENVDPIQHICDKIINSMPTLERYAICKIFFCVMSQPTWINVFLTYLGAKEFYIQGYNAVYFIEGQPAFRRKISSPSAGLKSKQSKKPAWSRQQISECYQYQHPCQQHGWTTGGESSEVRCSGGRNGWRVTSGGVNGNESMGLRFVASVY